MNLQTTAKYINTIANFCAPRDLDALTPQAVQAAVNTAQVDVMVLFGGSILAGGDVLAEAIKNKIAHTYVIVGGAGHTTETLRQRVHAEYPAIETANLPESEVFQRYLRAVHGCEADLLETASTNCGNNISCLLDLLRANGVPCRSIILTQDATMQRRMAAGLAKMAPDIRCLNYAAYRAKVVVQNNTLTYAQNIHGMWDVDRYVNLLMGEIPRLTDDADGYGPNGKNFIAHVDVPAEVRTAYAALQPVYGTRAANPAFASR